MADSYPQAPVQAAQGFPPQAIAQQALSPDQLSNLVAPIALYPDPLLGQILAASTYPLELVEAQQWLQQNGSLQGRALEDAARQQEWDPSVQVLAAFPDVVALLNRDIRWTTDLGNAFLSQQADVMNAIQALRFQAQNSFQAQNNGRLASSPQQVVTDQVQNGQTAVSIEPANPQVIYPPIYNPAYVWGPPAWGAYPQVYYPGAYGGGYGFGSGINIAGLFSGLISWGGWGWVLGWFTHSLSLASLFFNVLGFHGFGGGYGAGGVYAGSAGAFTLWAHNPVHRLGVAYPRGFAGARGAAYAASRPGSSRLNTAPLRSSLGYYSNGAHKRAAASAGYGNRAPQISGYQSNSYRDSSYRGSPYRDTSRRAAPATRMTAPQVSSPRYMAANPRTQRFSAPKYSAPKYSAPKYSSPKFSAPKAPHFSAPKSLGGGHSGKSSHKH